MEGVTFGQGPQARGPSTLGASGSNALIAGAYTLLPLFQCLAADMTSVVDQQFTQTSPGLNNGYMMTNVIARWKSGAYSISCLGGIYTGAGKTGDILVSATQSWAPLTGIGTGVLATLAALAGQKIETATPYLSLTTGNTGALSADFFIYGIVLP